MTAFTVLVAPLLLWGALSAERLIWLMILLSPFEAAAAVVVGGRGIMPAYLPAAMFCGLLCVHLAFGGGFARWRRVEGIIRPALLALAYMLVSAATLPSVFAWQIDVWPQKTGAGMWWTVPLVPSSSNVSQSLYVLLDFMVMSGVAMVVSSWRLRLDRIYYTYLVCSLMIVLLALWQFASRISGLPFAGDLLYSNPGVSILSEQSWAGMPRVNGTFAEPESLAAFLAGSVYSTGWIYLQGRANRLVKAALVLGCIGLVLSTSTTGFVTAGLGFVGCATWAALTGRFGVSRRLWGALAPALALAACIGVAAPIVSPRAATAISEIYEHTANKTSSQSFDSRTRSDIDSLSEFVQSYGLGVGWGSNRSSSLLPGLLAGAGAIGFGLLVMFGLRVRSELRFLRGGVLTREEVQLLQGGAAMVVGSLIAALLSGPSITSLPFFIMLGGVIGVAARPRLRMATVHRWASVGAHPAELPVEG